MSSNSRPNGDSEASATLRANLASLLLCFLSILSVCLTIFNLYLFVWVWSSLSGSGARNQEQTTTGQQQQQQQQQQSASQPITLFEQLEMLRNQEKLMFRERLLARGGPVEVPTIRQLNEGATLRLASANEIQLKVGALPTTSRQNYSLIVSARHESLEFPGGLLVRSAARALPLLECRRASGGDREPLCRLSAKQLELGNPAGVDFGSLKSIQTGHVRSRRLHSALNRLQLMTGGPGGGALISFESRDDQIHLRALDSVSLGSRNTTVIIKAKTIKLGAGLVELPAIKRENAERQHKLCVCLHEQREREQEEEEETTNQRANDDKEHARPPNNGLVFAIQNRLRCAQFSERFCANAAAAAAAAAGGQ